MINFDHLSPHQKLSPTQHYCTKYTQCTCIATKVSLANFYMYFNSLLNSFQTHFKFLKFLIGHMTLYRMIDIQTKVGEGYNTIQEPIVRMVLVSAMAKESSCIQNSQCGDRYVRVAQVAVKETSTKTATARSSKFAKTNFYIEHAELEICNSW